MTGENMETTRQNRIKDIRDHMLSKLNSMRGWVVDNWKNEMGDEGISQEDMENYRYYPPHSPDGYCSPPLFRGLMDFWSELDEDGIHKVITGEIENDLELDGGRNYFITSDKKIIGMLASYVKDELGWTEQEFEDNTYNSTELVDEIWYEAYEKEIESSTKQVALKPLTIGEQRVRTGFNPSQDDLVSQLKQKTAELINICENLKVHDARLASLAQTSYEEAAMWAVKAATA